MVGQLDESMPIGKDVYTFDQQNGDCRIIVHT